MSEIYSEHGELINVNSIGSDLIDSISNMDDLLNDYKKISNEPEVKLWTAVISQAIADAEGINLSLKRKVAKNNSEQIKINADQRSALYFLSSNGLDEICHFLFIDADCLREGLKQRFEWAKVLFSENGFSKFSHL